MRWTPPASQPASGFVTVVNASSPELDQAAAGLAEAGMLKAYLRRYVNRNRVWERALASAPLVGETVRANLGRRPNVGNLSPGQLVTAGFPYDVASAALARLGARGLPGAHTAATWSLRRRADAIDGAARKMLESGTVMVAAMGTVGETSALAASANVRLVINCPWVHPRTFDWQSRSPIERRFAEIARTEALSRRVGAQLKRADYILLGSRYAASTFVAAGFDPCRLVVVPYGVDTELFQPTPRAVRPGLHVIFVGRVTTLKGIDVLLRAFSLVASDNWTLTVVGNPMPDAPRLTVRRGRVRHLLNVPQRLLPAVYEDADVLVLPTLGEGLGLVVLEAMASGLPVVVSANGPGEVVRQGVDGFIVPAGDAEPLADRLRALADSPELRLKMGAAARIGAVSFDWSVYRQRLTDWLRGMRPVREEAYR